MKPESARDADRVEGFDIPPLDTPHETGPLHCDTEDAIALQFASRHAGRVLFDHDANRWYEWRGSHWQSDGTGLALQFARQLAREASPKSTGKGISSAGFARGAETLAQVDRRLATTADRWDREPMLLGTPGGTVDLRTGATKQACPADKITKVAGAAPEPGDPVRWLAFLNEATGGDAELVRFLRQWCGYCLTGLTSEHALLFIYGPGGNGKSVFQNTVTAVLGDYAATAAMETFTESRNDRHSTELAMLRGARVVTANETEAGRAWAEAKVKTMTGGDPVSARFMRQDNFTFTPQFKLTVVGNHAPELRNVDDAMKRRFNIVPFFLTPANPDRDLENKLRAELGRILSWAIEGCLDWQANGLIRPAAVVDATADYFDAQDMIGQWIEERCDTGPAVWEIPSRAYRDWCDFAKARGGVPGTIQSFTPALGTRGIRSVKSHGVRQYKGLVLRPHEPNEHGDWPS